MGELHLQILEDRSRRQFRVPSASLGRMRVAYRERPTIAAVGRATHDVTNSSGKRTYAHVELEVEQDADSDAVVIVSNSSADGKGASLGGDETSSDVSSELSNAQLAGLSAAALNFSPHAC